MASIMSILPRFRHEDVNSLSTSKDEGHQELQLMKIIGNFNQESRKLWTRISRRRSEERVGVRVEEMQRGSVTRDFDRRKSSRMGTL